MAASWRGATALMTFEGLKEGEQVLNFYNGGLGSMGSGPGPNFGVTFTSTAVALTHGNFGGEPSPPTVMTPLDQNLGVGATVSTTLNIPAGFTLGLSLYYSAIDAPGQVKVFSGVNDTGSLLATLALPVTPSIPPPTFSPFFPTGVTFSGTAESVELIGPNQQILFDDILLGVPEPSSTVLLLVGIVSAVAARRKHRGASASRRHRAAVAERP